jgi:hypothetical protein
MERLAKFMELTEHELFRNMSVKFQAELVLQAWQQIGGGVQALMLRWRNVVCEAFPPDDEHKKELVDLLKMVIPDTIEKGVKEAVAEFWKKRKRESIDGNKRNPTVRLRRPNLEFHREHFLEALRVDVAEHDKEWMGQKDLENRVAFIRIRSIEVEVDAVAAVRLDASFTAKRKEWHSINPNRFHLQIVK